VKKPAPKVADPVAEIDAEIARLRGLANARQAELDADVAKHINHMNHGLQSRLDREIKGIQGKIDALDAKRFAIELHDEIEAPPPPNSRPPATTSAKWNLKENLKEPEYPTGARAAGRKKEIDAAFDRFRDFYLALTDKHFSKLGSPRDTVDLSLLSVACGM
jgi:hypothetical protein